jgi:hypothetical protein
MAPPAGRALLKEHNKSLIRNLPFTARKDRKSAVGIRPRGHIRNLRIVCSRLVAIAVTSLTDVGPIGPVS